MAMLLFAVLVSSMPESSVSDSSSHFSSSMSAPLTQAELEQRRTSFREALVGYSIAGGFFSSSILTFVGTAFTATLYFKSIQSTLQNSSNSQQERDDALATGIYLVAGGALFGAVQIAVAIISANISSEKANQVF